MAKQPTNQQQQHLTFEWNEYGRAVLQSLELLEKEVGRIRDQIEDLQKMTATVQTIVTELGQAKCGLESVNKGLAELKRDFGNCQLTSVKTGGENGKTMATLEERLKNTLSSRALLYSIASGVIATLAMLAMKLIFKL